MIRYDDLIEEIEEKFDVSSLKYKGICLWPLFRIELFMFGMHDYPEMVQPYLYGAKEKTKKSLKIKLGNLLWAWKDFKEKKSSQKKFKKAFENKLKHSPRKSIAFKKSDFLFFHLQAHRNFNLQGKYLNIFLDPLIDVAEKEYSCFSIETLSDIDSLKETVYKESYLVGNELHEIEVSLSFKHLLKNLSTLFLSKKTEAITGFDQFRSILPLALQTSVFSNEGYFIKEFQKIEAYKKMFVEMFNVVQPKFVFQASFYHSLGLALNMACYDKGIKSVDVQHGILEPMAYWGYKKRAGVYEMLPHHFWLWDKDSCEIIKQWKKKDSKAILGGNIWTRQSIKIQLSVEQIEKFNFITKDYTIKILVSIQPYQFVQLPSFIIDAIIKNKNIYWLFRLHPRSFKEDKIKLKALLDEKGIFNCEIDLATELPLTFLLSKSDIHITKFSAVVFDAALFGVPTIFIDEYAKKLYSRSYPILWNSGLVYLAENANDLLNLIHQQKRESSFNADEYFGNQDYSRNLKSLINLF